MMPGYPLSITTPMGKVFEGPVLSLRAPGTQGSFGVLKKHAPMITTLNQGVLTVRDKQGEKFYRVTSGILEVDQEGNVLVLADSARFAQTMDEAQESSQSGNSS